MAATDKFSGEDGKCRHGATATITDATHNAGTVTVTATAHGFSATDRIEIASVVGMTDINDIFVIQTVPTADTFTITKTTAQSYTSGGSARKIIPITEWEISSEVGVCNVTDSSSSSWKERIPSGWTNVSGSFVGFLLDDIKGPVKGTTIALKLDADSTNYWEVDGIINGSDETLNVTDESAVALTYTFEGTGTLTETL